MRNVSNANPCSVSSLHDARIRARLLVLLVVTGLLAACGTSPKVRDPIVVQFLQAGAQQEATTFRDLEGAVVTDTVSVVAQEDPRFSELRFHLNDEALEGEPTVVASQAPYEMELDTRELEDGAHTLTVTADVSSGEAPVVTKTFVVANETDEAVASDTLHGVPAATLYVAPDGSDSADGRSAGSAVSIQRATELVGPGDVVYLGGGTYSIDVIFTVSGTSSAPITWTSAPGEWAVFDGSDQAPISSTAKFRVKGASWNVFQNLEVRNGPREGIMVEFAHDNVFRDVVTHSHQYSGIANFGGDRNLYEGITTYDNFDDHNPRGMAGEDADGIALSSGDSNVVRRVVTYGNSDDGIDAWKSTNTLIENVVAFDNGRGSHGNGNGIKAGGGNGHQNDTIVRNSIAYGNKANGFDDNSGLGVRFENNTAFDNGGYAFMGGSTTVRRNNIAVGGGIGDWGAQDQNNTWNLGIADPSFVSTDPTHPDFLALADGSAARGAGAGGVDLGALSDTVRFADLIGPRTLNSGGAVTGATAALR